LDHLVALRFVAERALRTQRTVYVDVRAHTAQFIRFLAAGGLAAAANIGSRILFSQWVALPAAVVLAYLVGMSVAFTLMRRYVFSAGRGGIRQQAAIFVLVNIAAVIQTLVVTLVLAQFVLPWAGVHSHVELIAHVVGVGVPLVTSFIGHKFWSFR
jgi:putative flippase GtrA